MVFHKLTLLLLLISAAMALFPLIVQARVNQENDEVRGKNFHLRDFEAGSIRDFKQSEQYHYHQPQNFLSEWWQIFLEKLRSWLGGGINFNPDLDWLKYLFYLAAALVVVFAIVKLFNLNPGNIFLQDKPILRVPVAYGESKNLSQQDYQSLIARAVEQGNLREAVKYHYLKCLLSLHQSGLIKIKNHKAPYNYQMELHSRKDLAASFGKLALKYEYAWYGQFPVDKHFYREVQNQEKEIYEKVNKA